MAISNIPSVLPPPINTSLFPSLTLNHQILIFWSLEFLHPKGSFSLPGFCSYSRLYTPV